MTIRTTKAHVEGAFKRLHKAMRWPNLRPYSKPDGVHLKANVGAVYLSETGYGFNIERIDNENGGVTCPFMGWKTKREAVESMINMAQAVELYRRNNE